MAHIRDYLSGKKKGRNYKEKERKVGENVVFKLPYYPMFTPVRVASTMTFAREIAMGARDEKKHVIHSIKNLLSDGRPAYIVYRHNVNEYYFIKKVAPENSITRPVYKRY